MKQCKGYSLLSLLVGMLISLITISGGMVAYRSALHGVVPAAQNASHDGNRMTGLLRAAKLVQGAGFGLDGSALGGDVRVLSDATLSGTTLSGTSQTVSPAIGNAIIWREDSTTGNCGVAADCTCFGLFSHDTDGGLQLLFKTSCGVWPSPAWDAEPLMDDERSVGFTVTADAGCTPYGASSSAIGTQKLAMATTMSTESSAGTETAVTTTVCLANLQ